MSLIFDALKKERAAELPSELCAPGIVISEKTSLERRVPVLPNPSSAAKKPWSGFIAAGLIGMLMAGGGAWLYGPSQDFNFKLASSVPPVQAAILPKAVLISAPVVSPPLTAPVISKPSSAVIAVNQAPAILPRITAPGKSTIAPVLVVPQTAKSASPEPAADITPVDNQVISTPVQLTNEATQFDAQIAFKTFLRLIKMNQLTEAGVAADKISAAMGRNHVMSLRVQGYWALQKNDMGQAKSQYLQLHDMLPEDREAGLNLALIDWRQGKKDSASKRVAELVEKFPNDAEIQALQFNVRNP